MHGMHTLAGLLVFLAIVLGGLGVLVYVLRNAGRRGR